MLDRERAKTSFNLDNTGEKKHNEAFQGVYFMRTREKTLKS